MLGLGKCLETNNNKDPSHSLDPLPTAAAFTQSVGKLLFPLFLPSFLIPHYFPHFLQIDPLPLPPSLNIPNYLPPLSPDSPPFPSILPLSPSVSPTVSFSSPSLPSLSPNPPHHCVSPVANSFPQHQFL